MNISLFRSASIKKHTLLIIFVVFLYQCDNSSNPASTPLHTDAVPGITRNPSPACFYRGKLLKMFTYDPQSSQQWQVDLRSYDLSQLDLSESLYDLLYADFDDKTIWPDDNAIPTLFNRKRIMELGKNPGLGIHTLHKRGITGKGIGVGMIDQPLLTRHYEFFNNLQMYDEINVKPDENASMHGAAVASIAVGKNVGVAPGACLYYIGSWPGNWNVNSGFEYNFTYFAQAIRRLLEINKELSAENKIRVIALQIGWRPHQKGYTEISEACEEAIAQGILIVCSCIEDVHGFKFHGLGRFPIADPDNFNSYEPGSWYASSYYAGQTFSDRLLVPMDSRTTASPTGHTDYVFYREGGWSWSIPYIAGMYALAAQVNSSITPDTFWKTAMETGRTIYLQSNGNNIRLGPILDPVALVEKLNNKLLYR